VVRPCIFHCVLHLPRYDMVTDESSGVIYPIMFYKLIGEVGFGWGVRILGFTALATLIIPIVVGTPH
jgi:hypothetical protein